MRPASTVNYVYANLVICCFGYVCLGIQNQLGCGFPGTPAKGTVMPYNEVYKINETVQFRCNPNFVLKGPPSNRCVGNNKWLRPVTQLPLCDEDLARGQKAYQSSTLGDKFRPELAIDGNTNTCSQTKESEGLRFWEVELNAQYYIAEITIDANVVSRLDFNISVRVGNYRNEYGAKECFNYSKSGLLTHKVEGRCGLPIKGQVVQIIDTRADIRLWRLNICEVKVFAIPVVQCGNPDNTPFCTYKNITTQSGRDVKYLGKPGYELDGGHREVRRSCNNGKWSGSPPTCIPATGSSSSGYNSPTMSTTTKATAGKSSTPDNSFVIGIAIGVTAASVSTIVVIIILIVVLRKYYKRPGPPQSITVTSETDSVFLRGNLPSSSDSGSPHVRQTYSDPWDNPKYHVYDYICPDTLRQDKANTEETSFIPTAPLVDSERYVINGQRNHSDRTNNSSSASEKLLPELPQRRQEPFSSTNTDPHSPPRRVCSYNELEVDAYGGYQDPSDVIRV